MPSSSAPKRTRLTIWSSKQERKSGSFGRTALAVLVLLVAAWLLIGVIGHLLSFIFSTLLLVVAVIAAIWALENHLSRPMAYLLIALLFGIAGGLVGRMKGSSFIVWFLISAIIPVLGLIGAIVYRSERDEMRRVCPAAARS